jgi:hypothetical protein
MILLVDFFQSRIGDVGIDLGCGDVGVAKHLLHRAQVSSM